MGVFYRFCGVLLTGRSTLPPIGWLWFFGRVDYGDLTQIKMDFYIPDPSSRRRGNRTLYLKRNTHGVRRISTSPAVYLAVE